MTDHRPTIDEIVESFAFIDDWEERYRYLIELGRDLEPLPDALKTEATRVRGCASQVWLVSHAEGSGPDAIMTFRGDSDAHIVRGLVLLTTLFYSGKTAAEVVEADAFALFSQLGLANHLTQQRANGLRAMIDRIRQEGLRVRG